MNTCERCAHWNKLPRGTDLSIPQHGECREHLHSHPAIQNTPQGPQILGWFTGYPAVPAAYPACGRFELPLITSSQKA